MANNALSPETERQLMALGNSRGAKRYGAWLGARSHDALDELGLARLGVRSESRRETIGYGARGEALLRDGLADDGYASYLRRAVKEARIAREAAVEAKRESEDLAALRGYAAYLESEREGDGAQLISLAEELISSPIDEKEAERRIAAAGVDSREAAALRDAYRKEGTSKKTGAFSEKSIMDYLRKAYMPYARAYQYCIDLGLSEADAKRLAKQADAEFDDVTHQLHSLFD